jgi:glyceraldehyde-3-phosphate dehydrogenase (NADP+)
MTSLPHRDLYVAGVWRRGADALTIKSPFDGADICTAGQASARDVEDAIAAAASTFAQTRKLPTFTRAEICRAIARGIAAQKEALALDMVLEGGKPIGDAKAEVDRAVHCFECAAAEAETFAGEMMPLDLRASSAGRFGVTKRVPVGPISAIAPFNFPLNLAVHKIAPAFAVGCPVILKPAPQTPSTSTRLAEIIDGTAWPKGAFSVLPAAPAVADALVTDERMKLLSFTGSPSVGWELKRRAGKKKVVLELGNNSAVIVDERVDVASIIPRLIYGSYSYAGQKCISVQRIDVHESLYADFVKRFVAASAQVKVGDPRDPDVLIGPLINPAAAARLDQWIDEAKARGARVLLGGPPKGTLYPATVLDNVPADAKLSCEEAFGPIVVLDSFRDFGEALARVNSSRFGLQTGVYSNDLKRVLASWNELEVGAVIVNDIPAWRIDPMPYGGVKDSGQGREGISASMHEMTELRLLVVNDA